MKQKALSIFSLPTENYLAHPVLYGPKRLVLHHFHYPLSCSPYRTSRRLHKAMCFGVVLCK